jgi:hypothetical protein
MPNIESLVDSNLTDAKKTYAARKDRRLWHKWRGLALWLVASLNCQVPVVRH